MNQQPAWQFAASTLGVLDEDLPTTVATMRQHGVTGVEVRSAEGAFIHAGLDTAGREEVRRLFTDAGIDLFAVTTGIRVAAPGDDDEVVAALSAELQLAADLGARFIRIFPGAPVVGLTPFDALPTFDGDPTVAEERAARRLARVLDEASELGVTPAIETHDSHPSGERLASLFEALDSVAPGHGVGVIWDVLHPWRVGEDLATAAEFLLPYVLDGRGYVQIKDVANPADVFPVLQGQGSVPLGEFLDLLDAAGYRGPVSLEWERFWQPTAPSLDAALAAAAAALAGHPPRSA